MRSFADDLRAVLIPERKWHYIFHFLVMAVASSYWLGSLIKQPEATWAEIAMYRPRGDNEVYPVITALSRFNFGDPTDALHYGKGTAGSQIVILFPYAVAYAIFGTAGYMVADVGLSWLYFLVVTILLRRCNFGNFSSLLVGSALAMRSLQILFTKLGLSFGTFLSLSGLGGTWEWGFPDLLDLQIFVQRIPRPMITGIFVTLLLYFLVRQWHERVLPSFRRGLATGALFAILLQGDPFSLSALGLLFLWVMGWTLAANHWKIPWRFVGGTLIGVGCAGAYFLWQRIFEHPDCAVRFGMADYPRDKILPLPGYGPLVRVGTIGLLAALVIFAARRLQPAAPAESSQELPASKKSSRKEAKTAEKTPVPIATAQKTQNTSIEKSLATFCLALVVAGWLAQPVQLLLLGKGCQIYHYLIFVLPSLYAYAFLILLFNFLKLATQPELPELIRRFGHKPHWTGALLLALVLGLETMVGMENKAATVSSKINSRQESNVPWAHTGELYRAAFRDLEKQFRENPVLKETKTFATFCYEVNFLLAAFYDKRAYLPDNAYSTLSDEELEDRLFETLKILQLPPQHLGNFIQVNFVLNYWLGCAKYWMTSDYQYSTRNDYTAEQLAELDKQTKQTPWLLCLPISEMTRLAKKYDDILARTSDRTVHPDAVIVGLEKSIGMFPISQWYQEVYTNDLFSVYVKNPVHTNAAAPSPEDIPLK